MAGGGDDQERKRCISTEALIELGPATAPACVVELLPNVASCQHVARGTLNGQGGIRLHRESKGPRARPMGLKRHALKMHIHSVVRAIKTLPLGNRLT